MSVAPPKPRAVLDANAIIGIAKSGCFTLVSALFSELYVPPLVVAEITDPLSLQELVPALGDWLQEVPPTSASLQMVPPHRSEADRHALALAPDHRPCGLITGDRGLTNKARRLQVSAVNAPQLIELLAEAGLIPAAKPCLDRMRTLGFGIRQELYEEILDTLGE